MNDENIWKSRKKYNKPKKPPEKVKKNLFMARNLYDAYVFISEKTHINVTDLIEYALLSALIPSADIQLYEYMAIHKSRGIKRGKKWTEAKIKALFNGLRDCAALYGLERAPVEEFIAQQCGISIGMI